ncbi:uncharacterized protein [Paramormyrops kingsleyae]|uniref:uncharacterized protein isoform X4 n=1 Tax=Paramormyrops kingsleyae TaxID=1676925 RepID=UPI003B974D39
MGNTPPSALQYVRNGRKILMDQLKFPISTAKELNQHGILSEEELCAIRGQSGRPDATSKLLDMVIAKGEQACCELLQLLQNIYALKLYVFRDSHPCYSRQHSPEEAFHDWIKNIPQSLTKGPTETSLPRFIGNYLYLDVKEDEDEAVFEEAGAIMKQHPEKMQLCLHVDQDFQHLGEALRDMIFKCLPQISRISVRSTDSGIGSRESSACSGIGSRESSACSGIGSRQLHHFVTEEESVRSTDSGIGSRESSACSGIGSRESSACSGIGSRQLHHFVTEEESVTSTDSGIGSRESSACSGIGSRELHHFGTEEERLLSPMNNFLQQLFLQAALNKAQTGQKTVMLLSELIDFHTIFEANVYNGTFSQRNTEFLLDLFSHIKDFETKKSKSLQSILHPVYQSTPAVWDIDLSKRKASILREVLKFQIEKKTVNILSWSDEENELKSFLQCLPYISHLRLSDRHFYTEEAIRFIANLFIQAAECDRETGERKLQLLSSVCSYSSFPFVGDTNTDGDFKRQSDFLLDLYSFLKECQNPSRRNVLLALQPVFQSVPAVWVINLSNRKASILFKVLKLQTMKKPVKLFGWSDEENELKSFLQCLPYISQLRYCFAWYFYTEEAIRFIANLFLQAAECDRETGGKKLQLLSSVCSYSSFPFAGDTNTDGDLKKQSDFLLDLYSFLKDSENPSRRNVLLELQPVFQSVPAVWVINLSNRKVSILFKVLKLQTMKKPVKLVSWSDEENAIKSFFQCLPYISQLGLSDRHFYTEEAIRFIANLFLQAAECDRETGGKKLQLLSSVCSYSSFPFVGDRNTDGDFKRQSDFLLDLYSFLKECQNPSRRNVLLALRPVFQSAPAVWVINLSNRKASILFKELELQTMKKPVKLFGWSDEENELKSFLQCLSYISQLGLCDGHFYLEEAIKYFPLRGNRLSECPFTSKEATRFFANLFIQAAECDRETREKKLQLLSSVCSYSSFPFAGDRNTDSDLKKQSDFLLDLYSFLKDSENPSRSNVLLALQPVYQSAPAVWIIDLSERKASTLLEVLEFQTVKKPVKLFGWSDEENELKSLLQCLPYISQLRLSGWQFHSKEAIRFIANLFIQAAVCDRETGEKNLQLLSSVCSYSSFPFFGDTNSDDDDYDLERQSNFLLDLYSLLKDCENPSYKHVLLALQSIYQSAPAVWVIDLSETKVSTLYEVLEFQTVKKPAKLVGWPNEENEQRSFLQCLHYVSELDISKQLLQQLLCLISVGDEVQAASLSRVLGREVNLSHILIDPQTCMSLAAVLEQAEGLSKLDLSHCQLNDHRVELLLPHLHKARVLDLSNNDISDLGALRIHSAVSTSSYIQTVRLFNNRITDTATFLTDPRYDLWDQSKGQITVELKPDLNSHNGEFCYSLSCESGGHFQCSATGLVFLMKRAGKVEYSPTYWDEAALKTAGYEPAGPLFNIENPEKGLCSLQLPHCEADVKGREHLSVAHICDGNMEVLKPLAVTDTHVKIHVQDLSLFGIVRSILSLITSSVRGQVLLFQPRRSTTQKQIYVFLLPSNVPLSQVSEQHKECMYIKTSSDCTLTPNRKYSVTSELEVHHEIQPKSQEFFWNFGPNFHPTFEIFFSNDITALHLAVLENGECEVWARKVHLSSEAAPDAAENCHVSQTNRKDYLLVVLEELTDGEMKNLKTRMPPPAGRKGIPKSRLHGADRPDLRNFMVESWGMEGSITAIKEGLSKIQRNDLIDELNDFLQKLSN